MKLAQIIALLTGLLSLLIVVEAPAGAPAFTYVYGIGFAVLCFITIPHMRNA